MAGHMKKEYMDCMGKPVIVRSILAFASHPEFSPIIITVPQSGIEDASNLLMKHLDISNLRFIEGGTSRQESVFNALRVLVESEPDYVLIHDGARPWITNELVSRVHENTIKYGACVPVIRISDALKELDPEGFVKTHLSHENICGAQTPQGFRFDTILSAHTKAAQDGVTAPDDAELYGIYSGRVSTVPGNPQNRKITYIHDIKGPQE
jgi:2-C-methyl-D-erythritol 4-phosphate cytidylyltransferase